tara:strand:- start:97 stop:315 length:219 start_codon:yes stop_codon:yes gene_type:complete
MYRIDRPHYKYFSPDNANNAHELKEEILDLIILGHYSYLEVAEFYQVDELDVRNIARGYMYNLGPIEEFNNG